MILNSHNRDTLVNTVSVNDRATVVGLSHRIIDGRSTVESSVHVRFAKSKAGKCALQRIRTAEVAAEPRPQGEGYAMPQNPTGFAEPTAQPRMAALWAALAMSRLSQV